jgi:hypothetical protein
LWMEWAAGWMGGGEWGLTEIEGGNEGGAIALVEGKGGRDVLVDLTGNRGGRDEVGADRLAPHTWQTRLVVGFME